MTTPEERDLLIERLANAWRPPPGRDGTLAFHPAWHDLDEPGRELAHDVVAEQRALEAALDPDGLSTTARALIARIEGRSP